MNLVKVAELLKNAPDQALMQELNNPSATAPSYMVISELQRRKKLRGSMMSPEPQSSVAEDLEMESARANQMGIGAMMPQPQMQPQQAPQGYAQGGAVQGYAYGGDVDYQDDLPWDERMRMWREMTGFGRMAPQPQVQSTFPGAAASQVRAADNRMVTANPDLTKVRAPVVSAPVPSTAPRQPSTIPAAGGVADYMNELKDYRKDLADAYQKQADVYQQQADKLESGKSKDVALALMQAGFGIMGGRSQNAAENIGQGAMPAIQQYAGMDRARQEQAQKLAMGQSQLGIESLRARMEGAKTEAGLGLTEREVGAKERTARAHEISAGASASQAGAYRQAANEARIIGLREKAIEALSKDQNFQFLSPQQQEAAIQRRMQLIGIPGAGSAPAAPAIAGTYNPKTGKIE